MYYFEYYKLRNNLGMKKIFTSICTLLIALCATAQLSYNVELTQADFNNPSTIIKKEGKIEWDGGIRCGAAYTTLQSKQ